MACDCKYFKYIQRPIFIIPNLSCKNYIYMYKFTHNLHWKFLAFTVTYMYEWINSCICTYFRQLKRFYFNCCIFKYMHVCFIFRAVKLLLLCNHAVHLSWTTSPYDFYLKPPFPIFFLLLIYIFMSSWNFITFFMTLLTYIIIDVFPWFRNTQMFDHCCMFRKSRVVISFQKEMLWHRDVNHLLLRTLVTRTSFLINLIVVYTRNV